MTTPEVRPAGNEDADRVFPFASELATSFRPERAAFDVSFREVLAHPDSLVLVADSPAGLAGYLLGFRHPTFFANGPVGWIEEVFVDSSVRRTGTGAALVAEFERWARRHGCALVALATRRAEDFYTAIGYENSAAYLRKIL